MSTTTDAGKHPRRDTRRFTLLDAVALIAAVAAGLAMARAFGRKPPGFLGELGGGWDVGTLCIWVEDIALLMVFFLFAITPTVLLLRLRKPRPPLRNLVLQPGAAACLIVLLSAPFGVLESVDEWLPPTANSSLGHPDSGWHDFVMIMRHCLRAAIVRSAYGVASVWILLALSRRQRLERSWIDRMGRCIGVLWIATWITMVTSQAIENRFPAPIPVPAPPPFGPEEDPPVATSRSPAVQSANPGSLHQSLVAATASALTR